MNTLAVFFALHARAAWALVVAASLAVALLAGWSDLRAREQLVGSQLQTEARRSSIEIMSTTLNGNLMGSVTLLGLIDGNIKLGQRVKMMRTGREFVVTDLGQFRPQPEKVDELGAGFRDHLSEDRLAGRCARLALDDNAAVSPYGRLLGLWRGARHDHRNGYAPPSRGVGE